MHCNIPERLHVTQANICFLQTCNRSKTSMNIKYFILHRVNHLINMYEVHVYTCVCVCVLRWTYIIEIQIMV